MFPPRRGKLIQPRASEAAPWVGRTFTLCGLKAQVNSINLPFQGALLWCFHTQGAASLALG